MDKFRKHSLTCRQMQAISEIADSTSEAGRETIVTLKKTGKVLLFPLVGFAFFQCS